MSVMSCEVDCPGSSNGNDFCCTEEELFESFMEIVNDPELQGQTSNKDEDIVDVKKGLCSSTNGVSDEISKDQGLTSEGNGETLCDLIVINSDLKDVDQVGGGDGNDTLDYAETSLEESCEDHTNENGLGGSNNHAIEPVNESLSNGKNEQDVVLQNGEETANTDETASERVETLDDSGIAEHDSSVISGDQDSITDSGNVNENDEQENQKNGEGSNVSAVENEQHASNCDPTEQKQNETEELGLEPVPELNQSNAEEVDVMPSQQQTNKTKPEIISSILLRQPTSPKRIVRDDLSSEQQPTSPIMAEKEVSSSNQQLISPTDNSKPAIVSSNLLRQPTSPKKTERHDSSSSMKTSEDVSSTDQNEAGVGSTNPSKLHTIEDSIEEGIRRAAQVCEELNAITQRLSLSSDEILGDNDSDSQKTDENNLETFVEPGVVNDGELSQNNNNIMDSKPDTVSDSKHESDANCDNQSSDDQVSNDVINHTDDLGVGTLDESKRPSSLPELVVTSQENNSLPSSPAKPIRSPQTTTTSPMETTPVLSPSGISPTHMSHLKDDRPDRKPSTSDSLDSSEGSLSGDTRSVGASPLEDRGTFNWEILNTALADAETDEDDGIYESGGSYGGFGLLLDDDTTSNLPVDDVRYRSVSQSSTVSEAKFQEEYIKNHKSASLDRKQGKLF